jgi:glucosamine-6-phosphate deaminase
MEVRVARTHAHVGALAADAVQHALAAAPDAVIGVATGSSPEPLYRELAARSRRGEVDLRSRAAVALDEYVGIARECPQSYHAVVDSQVTRPLGLDPRRVHVPDGVRADHDEAAADHERIVRSWSERVQIVGIGANGHLGFNEPGSSVDSVTRVVRLTPATRAANARFFDHPGDVPTHAITQGIATILAATTIVLVAAGPSKAEAVAAALTGPVTPLVPASFLQTHPDVVAVIDASAASILATLPGPERLLGIHP